MVGCRLFVSFTGSSSGLGIHQSGLSFGGGTVVLRT